MKTTTWLSALVILALGCDFDITNPNKPRATAGNAAWIATSLLQECSYGL
jgi:hypothetical protein